MNRYLRIKEPYPNRIAIFRALHLGDLMCAVPAFRALRMAFPNAQIALIGLPWASEFVSRFKHYLDELIEFPGYPGFPERQPDIQRIPAFITEMQNQKFDLVMQMQGSGSISNSLVMLWGAKRSAGFFLPGQYCPEETTYLAYPLQDPETHRHLRLMEFLGIPLQGDKLEFPIFDEDWDLLKNVEATQSLTPGAYVCIHPGARALDRRWALGRFVAVAEELGKQGLQIVLTGSKEEEPLAQVLMSMVRTPVVNLVGQTTLGSLGALLSRARLLICNDTGVSHVAAALDVPSVVLFTTSDPKRWAPLDKQLHRVISWATGATPQTVLREAQELLQKVPGYAE